MSVRKAVPAKINRAFHAYMDMCDEHAPEFKSEVASEISFVTVATIPLIVLIVSFVLTLHKLKG